MKHSGLTMAPASPQKYARIAGLLYLLIIAIGLVGEAVVRNELIVSGDAAATAQRIIESELLWRIGVTGQIVLLVLALPLTLLWYLLLRPVSRNLAMLGVFFALVSLAVYR